MTAFEEAGDELSAFTASLARNGKGPRTTS